MTYLKNLVLLFTILFAFTNAQAESKKFNMVFVPASEKGDESDYAGLIKIVEDITKFEINTIKVTDYNAAVEAMRAGRADIAWYGGKTYIKAVEIADAEAFAAGVRPGEKDAGYYAYFVVKKDSKIKKFSDVKGKVLSLNSIGSTSGDLIPQVELAKINLSTTNEDDFKNVFYAGSHDACLLAVLNNKADVCGMSSRNYEARLADNTFKTAIRNRWDELRSSAFSNSAILDRISAIEQVLYEHNAIERNFSKWPILGEWIWPNHFVSESQSSIGVPEAYKQETNYLKSWIIDRLQWMDGQISQF